MIKKELCKCGEPLLYGPLNIYRIETWRYDYEENVMKLIYAKCHHDIVVENAYIGDKNATNKKR